MERNEPCWCGSGLKYKKCHMAIDEKIMLHAEKGEIVPRRNMLKTKAQICLLYTSQKYRNLPYIGVVEGLE